ncbi:uncharacterized protein LOC141596862 [Silene latifolia]|uniref:uncharacterized protein LOC141596862 n=1 Tax=Silene latifolia TaxID=37657 RepID=UPI003D78B2FA
MSNQPQPRPWFRLGSLARPTQPLVPPPAPAPSFRPQMQPPSALLPRPTLTRPTFRPPVGTQPQPGQDAAPPLQPPRTLAPPPPLPSVTRAPIAPPLTPSSVSSPKPLPRIATRSAVTRKSPPTSPTSQRSPLPSPATQKSPLASPVTQKSPLASPITQKSPLTSPVIQKSPLASPVTQKSPYASPVTQKSPPPVSPVPQRSPLTSPVNQKYSSPSPSSLPPSPKQGTQSPPPWVPSSPAMKQEVAKSVSASPFPKPASPYANKIVSPTLPSSLKPSNGFVSAAINPPVPSPRAAKPLPETPPESPKIKSALHSPPSFSLPPSQFNSGGEYERKIPAISEQKTVLKPHDNIYVKPKEQDIKRASDSDETGLRVITICGENKGAIMELGYSPRRQGDPHKLRSDGELSEGNSSNEGRSKMQGRNHNARARSSMPTHTFMNSNVQGINSSIVFNSTLSHHDPGVHLSLSRKPVKGHHKEHSNGLHVFHKEAANRFSD